MLEGQGCWRHRGGLCAVGVLLHPHPAVWGRKLAEYNEGGGAEAGGDAALVRAAGAQGGAGVPGAQPPVGDRPPQHAHAHLGGEADAGASCAGPGHKHHRQASVRGAESTEVAGTRP